MNTNHPLNHQLLDEYGLNEVTYRLLAKVAAQLVPVAWPTLKAVASAEKITGNPAPSMRKLVHRGLLIGPAQSEDINTRPFVATQSGYNLLGRIERGLHTPGWLSASRVRALKWLSSNDGRGIDMLRPRGISMITMRALRKAGYISTADEATWRITDLGREAWAEWLKKEASS